MYNPGIARFLSVDPLARDYPWYSPYQFAGNGPIAAADLDGLEEWDFMEILLDFILGNSIIGRVSSDRSEDEVAENIRKMEATLDAAETIVDAYDRTYGMIIPGYSALLDANQGEYSSAVVLGLIDVGGGYVLRPVAKIVKPGIQYVHRWAGGEIRNLVSIAFDHGDEVKDLVIATGRVDNTGEIFTSLSSGTLEDGLRVVNDIIGDLGDDAVNVLGKEKRGIYSGKVLGKSTESGKTGFRIDFDPGKGAHINWWTQNQKGAVLLDTSEEQVRQIVVNEILK